MGNVGRVDDAGETSLAAATAAIITARWSTASHAGSTAPAPAATGSGFDDPRTNGHSRNAANGHEAAGYATNGHEPHGYEANGYEPNGYEPSGYGAGGHGVNGHDASASDVTGYAAAGYEPSAYAAADPRANGHEPNGHAGNGHAGNWHAGNGSGYPSNLDPHPVDAFAGDPYATGLEAHGAAPHDPYVADPYGASAHSAWAPPVDVARPAGEPMYPSEPSGGGQLTEAQIRHDSVAFGSAAASFFAATHLEVVPEVFPTPRIPEQRGATDGAAPVMPDLRFPDGFAPDQYAGDGFSAFGPANPAAASLLPPAPVPLTPVPPAPVSPARVPLAPDEVTGTRVPPGFERRTFGPFPDDPAPGFTGAGDGPGSAPGPSPADGFPPAEAPAFPAMGEFGAFDKPAYGQGVTQFGGSEFAPPPLPSASTLTPQSTGPQSMGPQSFATGPAYPAFAPPVDGPLSFPPSDAPASFEAPHSYEPPQSFETSQSYEASEPFGAQSFAAPPFATPPFATPPFAPPSFNPAEFAPPTFDPAEFAPPSFDFGSTRDLSPEAELPRREARGGSPLALLPRRTPQIPDVPEYAAFANDPLLDPSTQPADGTDLTRIATYLSSLELLTEYKPDGFDFADVLEAVKGVRDVRDAHLRWNSGAGHTLRIEFTDDADEAEVTRVVVRLLREKMGLAAGPSVEEPTLDRPLPRPRASVVASASVPTRAAPAGAAPAVRLTRDNPLPRPSSVDSARPRVVVDHVQVTTLGTDATVEVRLLLSRAGKTVGAAVGTGQGPAVDAYLLRLAATSAGTAVDELLAGGGEPRGRCFIEHVTVVPFGVVEVAIVVLLLAYDGHTEQLTGSAIVSGDPRQAVVRATLAALNRRLESLLS